MNLQIETVTLQDGSKMDVIRDIEAVRRLVRFIDRIAVCDRCGWDHMPSDHSHPPLSEAAP